MPKIVKQSPTSRPSPQPSNGAVTLSRGLKMCSYGESKTGKTRFFATMPKPSILIGTEDGTESICTDKSIKRKLKNGVALETLLRGGKELGIDFVKITESAQLDEITELAGSYLSIGLDQGGGLQDIIMKEVAGFSEIPVQKTFGMFDRSLWGAINMQVKERIKALLDYADKKGRHVFVIAHERSFKDDGVESELVKPKIGPALSPGSSDWLCGATSYICQFVKRQGTVTQKVKNDEGVEENVTVATGRVEYSLRIAPHSVYVGGFRSILDAHDLPPFIDNPTFDKLVKVIKGEKS